MTSLLWYALAALGEIAGCFAFWMWLRLGKSPLWTLPGVVSLVCFALALTRIETAVAGRAYAACGGIYILSSLLWLWLVEKTRPDHWDIIGACICILGAAVILYGPPTANTLEAQNLPILKHRPEGSSAISASWSLSDHAKLTQDSSMIEVHFLANQLVALKNKDQYTLVLRKNCTTTEITYHCHHVDKAIPQRATSSSKPTEKVFLRS